MYSNYHRHSHYSCVSINNDSVATNREYAERAKELGHTALWSTEHGWAGNIIEIYELANEFGLKPCCAGEYYVVEKDTLIDGSRDKRNYHIVIIPKSDKARRILNIASSKANMEQYYYKPRLFVDDILELDADDYFITTACIGGILKDVNAVDRIFVPLAKHFKSNMFCEVQSHNCSEQKEINKKAIDYSRNLGIRLISGCDSHWIDSEGKKIRSLVSIKYDKGEDINDEGELELDYPSEEELIKRFKEQGVLSDSQIYEALESTMIIERGVEPIIIDSRVKIPNMYPNLSREERIALLKEKINTRFRDICKEENLTKQEIEERIDAIKYEMKIIEDCSSIDAQDYFLFTSNMCQMAQDEYGGCLTRTGRGSCASYYINRVLGLSQIDRMTFKDVPMFPERFLSVERCLVNKSLPDIDFNVSDQRPFIDASRKILGENNVFCMVSWKPLEELSSFKTVCRAFNIPPSEANEASKDLESSYKDKRYKEIIDLSRKLQGSITTLSPHPCSFLCMDTDVREEFGIIRVGSEKGYVYCCPITSSQADKYTYVKVDLLVVTVWDLISKSFSAIGKRIIQPKELMEVTRDDKRIWKLFADGITATLNQVDSDNGRLRCMEWAPRSAQELGQLAAAIRPSFNDFRQQWASRVPFSFGVKAVDDLFSSTNGYILYQECLLTFFGFLGLSPEKSIITLKKINKKKMTPEEFSKLESDFKIVWKDKTDSGDEEFQRVWDILQTFLNYGFCSSHALSTGLDSLYGAYLKVNYPLEYFTVCLNTYSQDLEETAKLIAELPYFGIKIANAKFRHASSQYTSDRESLTIYRSIAAYKYINKSVPELLQQFKDNYYNNFVELYYDMSNAGINSQKIDVLIKMDFFSEFGEPNYLLKCIDIADGFRDSKVISKSKLTSFGISEALVRNHAFKETNSQFKIEPDALNELIVDIISTTPIEQAGVSEKAKWSVDFTGGCNIVIPEIDPRFCVVIDVDDSRSNSLVKIYQLKTGKMSTVKVRKKKRWGDKTTWTLYGDIAFGKGDTLFVDKFIQLAKPILVNGKWSESETEKEWFIRSYHKTTCL